MAATCPHCGATTWGPRCHVCNGLVRPPAERTGATSEEMAALAQHTPALTKGDVGALAPLLADPHLLRFSLLVAAEAAPCAVLEFLLERGALADVYVADEPHVTPMSLAIRRGDTARVRALIGAGALARRREAELSLHRAAARENPEIVHAIVESGKTSVDAPDIAGERPLVHACRSAPLPVIRTLLDLGASVDAHDADGRTALMAAAARGRRDVVELLVEAGADPALADDRGDTALATAERRQHFDVVRFLAEVLRAEKTVREGGPA